MKTNTQTIPPQKTMSEIILEEIRKAVNQDDTKITDHQKVLDVKDLLHGIGFS